MTGPAELVIEVRQGDTVVHRYVRSTSQPTGANVQKMLYQALGWMQSYAGAVNEQQWAADVQRAAEAQAVAEQQADGDLPSAPRAA